MSEPDGRPVPHQALNLRTHGPLLTIVASMSIHGQLQRVEIGKSDYLICYATSMPEIEKNMDLMTSVS